jgi:hypothetical protein
VARNYKHISFWKEENEVLSFDNASARSYISKLIGLEACKIRTRKAIEVFKKPEDAVTNYNMARTALETGAGKEFLCLYEKASELGYSEEQAKLYATKCSADWLKSEIELLDFKHPYAGNTDMMINAKLGAPILGQCMQVEADSSVPIDIQQRVPIHRQAMPARGQKKRSRK